MCLTGRGKSPKSAIVLNPAGTGGQYGRFLERQRAFSVARTIHATKISMSMPSAVETAMSPSNSGMSSGQ
jgi:hypothetical protein